MSKKRDKFAFFVKATTYGLTQPAFSDESTKIFTCTT